MSWAGWAENLDKLAQGYERPPGAVGMITDAELNLAECYVQYSYTGAGKIVELGCWLGAVTLALARGLSNNERAQRKPPIEAFDRFRWEPWMTPIADRLGTGKVADGESFLELTKANIKPYEHLIRLREEDLLQPRRFREPIEFLFVDAMKSWDLANSLSRTYFPRLVAGSALIVQQDFAFHAPVVATNHILMWLLRDRVTPVYHAPGSCSVVFFVHHPLERRDLPSLDRQALTPDMVEQAWDHSFGAIRAEARRAVWLCKVLFFIEQGWLQAAWEEGQRFVHTTGRVGDPEMPEVLHVVAQKSAAADSAEDRQKLHDLRQLLCGV